MSAFKYCYLGMVALVFSMSTLGQTINDLTIMLNGRLKADFIYDMNAPSGDRINYKTITPSDSPIRGGSRAHARESRIFYFSTIQYFQCIE